jgi:two-component system, chemotaxis family, chemotaxis protein CheY
MSETGQQPAQSGRVTNRLLIVDDSKVMRDMVAACLRPLGDVSFDFAASGLEAIERLALAEYDLVVLDLNMPDVGGIEVIEFIRQQSKLSTLPILVVTTRGDDASRSRVLEAGASGFLAKPFAPDQILTNVRGLLAGA